MKHFKLLSAKSIKSLTKKINKLDISFILVTVQQEGRSWKALLFLPEEVDEDPLSLDYTTVSSA